MVPTGLKGGFRFTLNITPQEYLASFERWIARVPAAMEQANRRHVVNRMLQVRMGVSNRLDLGGLELTALPPGIGELINLTVLNLNNNRLAILPPEIGDLTNLTVLNLNGNRLTTLPSEIGSLTHLTVLNLNNNQLTRLPAEIGNLTNLDFLDLSNNQLTTLSLEVGSLAHLVELNLSNNQLTSFMDFENPYDSLFGQAFIAVMDPPEDPNHPVDRSAAARQQRLAVLRIHAGNIRLPDNLRAFYRGLPLPNLECLYLNGNPLLNIGPLLSPRMVELDLGNTRITELPSTYRTLTQLETVTLPEQANVNNIPQGVRVNREG
ncbi:hypothetical protein AB835_12700 [Candidatus Endobugula sertula]|uniref:Disease resistance R13L4/SHOC-2-like LRR domain-containing protein n=1 Tax=Candidatus Endobugula sertula TaxID=62101 RepID=A0A1D2QMB8_9GAMM|nr:hypothetical protein AB835_12700 [Candidatus Endobugula sertula]